ncbi:hypothetical protein TL16_g06866 [Triparma laevis f. inornata]|uniref:Uncharacterized protein n=1 Tax=Triparma laevis f. inornata TaxID=1714386 RepID=A0A9W7AWL8_9STRA|nr:hypothetical protein TL16_g06866 [Triparma laevis f. inornata]
MLKQGNKQIAVVDCTYEIDAAAGPSTTSTDLEDGKIEIGSLVTVKTKRGEWVVTRTWEVDVFMDAEADAELQVGVEAEGLQKTVYLDLQNLSGNNSIKAILKSSIELAINKKIGHTSAKPKPSNHLTALALVNQVMCDTGSVLKHVTPKGIVPLAAGQKFITEEFKMFISAENPQPGRKPFNIKSIDYYPVADDFVEKLLAKLGEVAWKLHSVDSLSPCKKLVVAVVTSLLREEDVHWAALSDLCNGGEETRRAALVGAAAKLGMVLGDGLESTEKLRRLSWSLDSILQFFFKTGLIRRNWSHGFQLVERHRPSLMASLNVMKGPSDRVMKLGKSNYLSSR